MLKQHLLAFFLLAVIALAGLIDAHPIYSNGNMATDLLRRSPHTSKAIQRLRSQAQASPSRTTTEDIHMKEIRLTKKASNLYLGLPHFIQHMVTSKLRSKNIALRVIQPWDPSDVDTPVKATDGDPVEIKVRFLRPFIFSLSGDRKKKVFEFFAELERMNIAILY
ncbi:hypothetical protein HDU67_006201 [Dinochytrium kinnereticum]|nr:hypothetical protein HDU67_006201 [Dinochytrium kinnereticum]